MNHPIRRVITTAAATAAVSLLFAATAAAAPPTQYTTNMPQDWGKAQAYAFVDQSVAKIDKLPAGSTYRMAGYLVNIGRDYVPALIRANKRGVNVRLVLDAHAQGSGEVQTQQLQAALGSDRRKGSFVWLVHGSGLSHKSGANLHVKLQQFSSDLTTSLGSQNLSEYNTRDSSNETQWWQDGKLYNAGRTYFNAMAADKGSGYRYHTTTSGPVKVHWYPKGPDEVAAALSKVKCSKTSDQDLIKIAMFQIGDSSAALNKARILDRKVREGCRVQVAWNYTPDRKLIGVKAGRILLSSHRMEIRNVRVAGKIYAHDKSVVMRSASGATRVISGSGNWIDNRSVNADAVVENTTAQAFSAYAGHFNILFATGKPAVQPVYGPSAASVDEGDEGDDFANR